MSENGNGCQHQPRKCPGSVRRAGVIPLHPRRSAPRGTTFDLVPILMAKNNKAKFLRRVDAAIEELKESLPLPKTG